MTRGEPQYDAVIVGGGHNGLTAACYLAGAGLSVAVLERGGVVGGAAVTEELIPGFCVSTGSYVLSLMPRRILDELDLWSAGLQYLARDPRIFVPFPDGTSLTWWGDPDRLHAELANTGVHVTTVVPGLMRTGSFVNAEMKGKPAAEGAWFGLSSSLPLLSIDAEAAARRTVFHIEVQATPSSCKAPCAHDQPKAVWKCARVTV